MASIIKRGDSYRIELYDGQDSKGRRIRHTFTWKPLPDMTPKKAEKALREFVAQKEKDLSLGIDITNNRQTFETFAKEFMRHNEKNLKPKTIQGYRDKLPRIYAAIGQMQLKAIKPQTLNRFYDNLAEDGIRISDGRATPKPALKNAIQNANLSHDKLAALAGTSDTTVWQAVHGRTIRESNAAAIANALGIQKDRLFTITHNTAPLSTSTINGYHRLLSSIFSQAVKDGLIPYNPAQRATPPSQKKHTPTYLQPDELISVLDALAQEQSKMWKAFFHLLAMTGCRKSELCGLHWSNVSLDLKRVRIDRALVYIPHKGLIEGDTKTSDVRFLNIPQETVDILKEWRAEQNELRQKVGTMWNGISADDPQGTDYVFTNDFGCPIHPDAVNVWLTKFCKRHGLRHINPHAYRHSVASILISQGVDPVAVSHQLGHSNVTTTENIYAHFIAEQRSRTSDCIADALLKNRKSKAEKRA